MRHEHSIGPRKAKLKVFNAYSKRRQRGRSPRYPEKSSIKRQQSQRDSKNDERRHDTMQLWLESAWKLGICSALEFKTSKCLGILEGKAHRLDPPPFHSHRYPARHKIGYVHNIIIVLCENAVKAVKDNKQTDPKPTMECVVSH